MHDTHKRDGPEHYRGRPLACSATWRIADPVSTPIRHPRCVTRQPAVPTSASVAARMSRQASRDDHVQITVRRLLHTSGARYRVNFPVLGEARRTIDIAFPRRRVAVFIDGCFWHGCPQHATSPRNNAEWWRTKLERNVMRDQEVNARLKSEGWTVLRFWEHEDPQKVAEQVSRAVHAARQDPRRGGS